MDIEIVMNRLKDFDNQRTITKNDIIKYIEDDLGENFKHDLYMAVDAGVSGFDVISDKIQSISSGNENYWGGGRKNVVIKDIFKEIEKRSVALYNEMHRPNYSVVNAVIYGYGRENITKDIHNDNGFEIRYNSELKKDVVYINGNMVKNRAELTSALLDLPSIKKHIRNEINSYLIGSSAFYKPENCQGLQGFQFKNSNRYSDLEINVYWTSNTIKTSERMGIGLDESFYFNFNKFLNDIFIKKKNEQLLNMVSNTVSHINSHYTNVRHENLKNDINNVLQFSEDSWRNFDYQDIKIKSDLLMQTVKELDDNFIDDLFEKINMKSVFQSIYAQDNGTPIQIKFNAEEQTYCAYFRGELIKDEVEMIAKVITTNEFKQEFKNAFDKTFFELVNSQDNVMRNKHTLH